MKLVSRLGRSLEGVTVPVSWLFSDSSVTALATRDRCGASCRYSDRRGDRTGHCRRTARRQRNASVLCTSDRGTVVGVRRTCVVPR
ncbi:MAG: hypothetical protein U5O16_36785 [Rhodococcus sp. (in: high G+C Gram-positive bacteria)]|uniref:hypothetical protein n=1 Tax=Rhodococcus sp. TaxID=1831 RepID=UPI002AD690E7|nr:hypothetical protein [Rhodococcus sp. (in: high G+C Gram-positive bacteria)]